MIRKILPALCVLLLAGVLSCNDTESVAPKKDDTSVAAPPRNFDVNAKLQGCLTSQVAYVYIRINSGSWTLVSSVTNTFCDTIGSFSADDGDFLEVKVLDGSGNEVQFRAKTALSCPTTSWPTYCGATEFELTSSDPGLAVTVSVNGSNPCGSLIGC